MKYFLTLVILCSALSISAQNVSRYLQKAQLAKQELNEEQALVFYKKILSDNPTKIKALTNASILCANIGHRLVSNKAQKSYYDAALIYAKTAFKLEPNNADANFALAVAYGRKVYTIMSPKPRIAMSAKIKKFAERAVRLNPNHNEAMTLLGMWHYERATLTLAEKKIVAFLGGLPKGNLLTAKKYLEKSKLLAPNNIATLMELGKVYKEIGNKEQTKKTWKRALTQTNKYQDDVYRKKEIRKRLSRI